jgi:hypothetical protein
VKHLRLIPVYGSILLGIQKHALGFYNPLTQHDSNRLECQSNLSCSVDLKNEYLDFARQHDWKESNNSVFRVNTAESYEALNLKSNGKNKYNIILSIDRIYLVVSH